MRKFLLDFFLNHVILPTRILRQAQDEREETFLSARPELVEGFEHSFRSALSGRTGRVLLLFIFILYQFSIFALFEYDRAISKAQKNDWKMSKDLLQDILVENPENPQLLYDLGVSSYKIKEFDKALFYFQQAAQSANVALQEKAYFNAGNTLVSLKQLPQAIEAYDKVLSLNPDNERASHNKEIVKKMLEEQKQEQKKNQNKQDKDKKENDSKEDQQQQGEKENQDQQKEKNDNSNDQQQNTDEDKKQNQKNETQKNNNHEQQSDPSHEQDQQNENDINKNNKQDETLKKQSQSQQEKKEQESTETNNEKAEQPLETSPQTQPSLSTALTRILNEQEKKDSQLNKQIIKANTQMPGGSNYDYNYW